MAIPVWAQRAGPAELPPAGFTGEQYVDSRGCLFVRAGLGGRINWVARIGSNRRPICGQPPTREAMARGGVPPVAAPEVPPRVVTAPPPPPVVATVTPPAVPVVAPPAARAVTATPGCPASAPVGRRFELVGGGSALVCTAPGVVISGARPGDPGRAIGPGAALSDPRMPEIRVPKGYRLAWADDRLNPNRGRGSVEGAAAMARIWTNDVPQVLVADRKPDPAVRVIVTASTKGAPAPRLAPVAGRFIQVGSFGVPQNARAAAARLAALGLPVQVRRATVKGRALEIVRAGPFASGEDVAAALASARAAGFRDAVVR